MIKVLVIILLLFPNVGQADRKNAFSTGYLTEFVSYTTGCPVGYTCKKFKVVCPNIVSIVGRIAIGKPTGQIKGVATFHTGQAGLMFYSDQSTTTALWMDGLINQGLEIAQIKWDSNWWATAGFNSSGIAKLACRPATVIKYVYDTFYVPLGLGRKSFITTGNSAGASQIAYPLAYYGLDNIIDVSIPTGGPAHSALQKSCMNTPGEENYWFTPGEQASVDDSYGIIYGSGPCYDHNPNWIPTWTSDAVAYGGFDYSYPNTKVHQLIGELDNKMLVTAQDYHNKVAASSFDVTFEVVSNTGHRVFDTEEGREAIQNIILQAINN